MKRTELIKRIGEMGCILLIQFLDTFQRGAPAFVPLTPVQV
jgi:hypothetical protein